MLSPKCHVPMWQIMSSHSENLQRMSNSVLLHGCPGTSVFICSAVARVNVTRLEKTGKALLAFLLASKQGQSLTALLTCHVVLQPAALLDTRIWKAHCAICYQHFTR